jgi:hypothetical protein
MVAVFSEEGYGGNELCHPAESLQGKISPGCKPVDAFRSP